jgi:hypothetical protein
MNQGNHRYTPPAAPSKPKNETYLERKRREEREAARAATDRPGHRHGQGASSVYGDGNSVESRENNANQRAVTAERIGAIRDETQYNLALDRLNDQPTTYPTRGGGGGGGGGYGVNQKKQAKATAEMLQELLASDRFGPRDITQELADIDGAVTADQADATAAEGRLGTFIDGMGNPYGDMSLTESQRLSPEYADLLTANGADAGAYKAEVGLANTLADLGNDSDERFRTRMSALSEAERGYNTLANKQSGDFNRSELAASGSALAARLREKKRVEDKATEAEEQQVIMTLINALAAAGETADIKDFF